MRNSVAVAFLTLSAAASGQELGTLFHTPKERDLLERLRRGEKIEATVITRPDPTITGYVKRSDGKSTVFLDKQPFAVTNANDEKLVQPEVVQRFHPQPPTVAAPAPASPAPNAGKNGTESSPTDLITKLKGAATSARKKAEEEE